jgi:hypothetical protein
MDAARRAQGGPAVIESCETLVDQEPLATGRRSQTRKVRPSLHPNDRMPGSSFTFL